MKQKSLSWVTLWAGILAGLWCAPSGRTAPARLAPAGGATASSAAYGSIVADGVDGNRDGQFYTGGSVWHTTSPDTAAFFEIDLGSVFTLDRVMIWPRRDAVQSTLRDFRIKALDATGATVWQRDFFLTPIPAPSPIVAMNEPWGTSALRGILARRVRIERIPSATAPTFMTFAEMEVWGGVASAPVNLARLPEASATASAPGFGTTVAAAVDGDLNGDYASNAVTRPIYHSAATGTAEFYQVDLGAMKDIDFITLYNRTDSPTTSQVRLRFLDTGGAEVHTTTVNISRAVTVAGGTQFDITYDPPANVRARRLRIENLTTGALALAEVEIFGPTVDIIPPLLVRRYPEQGALFSELTSVDMSFNEDMIGVTATDLLINGSPATSVTAQGLRSFIFSFPTPSSGLVTLTVPPSSMTDAAGNGFVGSTWSLTVDSTLPAPRPFISEFMADNRGGLRDVDGDAPDWIEIYNPGPTPVNLGGWFLSDTATTLMKWAFPTPTVLEPGQSVVVFASSKNRAGAGAELHTNFKLDPDGESVILTKPDGITIASSVLQFPPQQPNVSYGIGRSFSGVALLGDGASARVLVPTGHLAGWTSPTYDDASWSSAQVGMGYDQSATLGGNGSPLAWWNFNNASTPTQALDATGHGNTGTVVAGAAFTADAGGRTGLPGDRAMNFPGTGVVTVPSAATGAFDAITTRNALTLSLWCYGAPTMPVQHYIFYAGSASTGGSRLLDAHLPWTDSNIYWDTAGCCDPSLTRIFVGEPNPANYRGRWNHYVFIKNGNRKEIWQNGFLLISGINSQPMENFRSLFLGSSSSVGGAGTSYAGQLDDIALWDGALRPEQIAQLTLGASPLSVRALTPLIRTDLGSAMRTVNATAYVRLPFTLTDPASLDLLTLKMRYDDGFVAWLNGVEITRRQAPASVAWNSTATSRRLGGEASDVVEIDISRFASLLRPGGNVLALQGLNASASDAEFLILPELIAGTSLPGRFFPHPTPGLANETGATGFVNDVKFSPQRGFYDSAFNVTLTCSTPGAIIRYSLDSSTPLATSPLGGASPLTVAISGTTTLRAAAFFGTLAPTNVDTHTYLFASRVAAQVAPPSAPPAWTGGPADFAMDARVPGPTPPPGYSLRESLLSLPTLSLTADPADLWGPNGLYRNPSGRGSAYERFTSVEWLDPTGNSEFHLGAGLRIHGNISRDKGFTPKHSFSLKFSSDYGATKLQFPLFAGSAVQEFDELVLRAGSTDTWPCVEWGPSNIGPAGAPALRWDRDWASYIRDQWARDAHLAMGHAAAHGRYTHLYLNGLYWGLYNLTESLGPDHYADHLGGKAQDWDAFRDFNEITDGTRTVWDQLLQMASSGQLNTDAGLRTVQGLRPSDGTRDPALPVLLHVDSLIDYMVLHILIGADDWPNHNWYAARRRTADSDGFHILTWDQEISNVDSTYERSSWGVVYAEASAAGTPMQLYASLRNSPEFRQRFADRIQRHHFNGGALTRARNETRWQSLVREIDHSIVAESARWGDYQANATTPGLPYTRENAWLPHLQHMAMNYWPQINAASLTRYRTANLFPPATVSAPSFSQHGGLFAPSFALGITHTNPAGTLRFTTDGSDPRLWGGGVNPASTSYVSPFSLSSLTVVKARYLTGTTWSPLIEATFTPNPDLDADGMDDAWESLHSLNRGDSSDADRDDDGDGTTNRAEYAALTDPHDPASRFSFTGTVTDLTGWHLHFTAQPGRRYRIDRSDDLLAPSWHTVEIIPPPLVITPQDITFGVGAERKFYRVVAEVPAP
jgi:Lamin Tail Domain/CotH kinase protein/Concanavalin A-like lectin/glucanases superfamily/Chitobiase/beta-hexosaminidase C-terminal domain